MAWAIELGGVHTQGGWVTGTLAQGERLYVGTTHVPTGPDGKFFYGIERKAPPELLLTLRAPGGTERTVTVLVEPRTFDVQHVRGVPQNTVTPNPAEVARARADSAKITAARAEFTPKTAWQACVIQPAKGRISGVYGSARTFNGAEKSWHKGLDIAAPTGTPIIAPLAGKVTFAADTFYNGNLVILDHGQHMFTIYAHMDQIDTQVGAQLAQGEPLGTIGTTGRSTGPHLHWGLYWRNVALDPALLLTHQAC